MVCGFWQAGVNKGARPVHVTSSSYILIEDVWAFGFGRAVVDFTTNVDNSTMRRVVTRWDDGIWIGEPLAGIKLYKANDNIVENCITLDHKDSQGHGAGHHGFRIVSWNSAYNASSNNSHYGNIALNLPDKVTAYAIETNDPVGGVGNSYKDCVAVNAYRGMGFYDDGTDQTTVENCTLINNRITSDKSHGLFNGYGVTRTVVRNTISANNLARGFSDSGDLSVFYSGTYANAGGDYNGTSCTTGCRTDDPQLKYITRIEDSSPYKGAGENGADIGANIIYKYIDGVLTNQPLWPWPHEDWIKEDMLDATFLTEVGRTGAGTPKWATTNKTLTEYIWEYLGNPIPSEIYGSTGSPTITITQPTSSSTFPTTNSTVTLGGTTTDDVSVSSVTWSNATTGDNGTAQGTTDWSISNIPLQFGSNIITVTVQDSDGNTSADTITVTYSLPDTEAPTTPTNLTATAISSSQINLSWTVSTDNIGVTGYKIYRDGVEITTTSNSSYQDTGLSPSTTYSYTVSAYDAAGNESGQSTASQATTTGDTTPPTISTASVSGDTKVIITFSEPVDQSSATNVSNYSINNGIIVSGASLGSDLKTVTLTTSPHTGNGSYTLTVNNIKDRANIPNVIASNTQATYTFPSQIVINNLTVASGKTYEIVQSGLQNGLLVYIDRTYTFSSVPILVDGAMYIKTANDDKNSSGASFITFDVNQNVTVYVAHDDRITTKPSWMVSFSDTGDNLVTTDTTLSIFANDYLAGTITLGGNESGGKSMYTVIIAGQGTGPVSDTTPPATPMGLTIQ
jgi:hypothetical protein